MATKFEPPTLALPLSLSLAPQPKSITILICFVCSCVVVVFFGSFFYMFYKCVFSLVSSIRGPWPELVGTGCLYRTIDNNLIHKQRQQQQWQRKKIIKMNIKKKQIKPKVNKKKARNDDNVSCPWVKWIEMKETEKKKRQRQGIVIYKIVQLIDDTHKNGWMGDEWTGKRI